jgi:hypothetical protein
VDSMYPLEYAKGSHVIREGEAGMVSDIIWVLVFLSLPISFTAKITHIIQLIWSWDSTLKVIKKTILILKIVYY